MGNDNIHEEEFEVACYVGKQSKYSEQECNNTTYHRILQECRDIETLSTDPLTKSYKIVSLFSAVSRILSSEQLHKLQTQYSDYFDMYEDNEQKLTEMFSAYYMFACEDISTYEQKLNSLLPENTNIEIGNNIPLLAILNEWFLYKDLLIKLFPFISNKIKKLLSKSQTYPHCEDILSHLLPLFDSNKIDEYFDSFAIEGNFELMNFLMNHQEISFDVVLKCINRLDNGILNKQIGYRTKPYNIESAEKWIRKLTKYSRSLLN